MCTSLWKVALRLQIIVILFSHIYTVHIYAVPVGPTIVHISLHQQTQLELVWRSEVCRGCIIDFYATSLWISKTTSRVDLKNVHCVKGVCRSVFDNLRPGQEYRAEVRAVRGNLHSSPSRVTKRIRKYGSKTICGSFDYMIFKKVISSYGDSSTADSQVVS